MTNKYTCSGCAFQIRSENDDELIDLVRTHADKYHDMMMTSREVRDGWESVDA